MARPYIELSAELQATELEFFSDASLNINLGFGARFDKEWLYGKWPAGFIKQNPGPSIEYAELYGLAVAVFMWAHKLRNK